MVSVSVTVVSEVVADTVTVTVSGAQLLPPTGLSSVLEDEGYGTLEG